TFTKADWDTAAPGKFEVKRLAVLGHKNGGMAISSGGYSASDFAGFAIKLFIFNSILLAGNGCFHHVISIGNPAHPARQDVLSGVRVWSFVLVMSAGRASSMRLERRLTW